MIPGPPDRQRHVLRPQQRIRRKLDFIAIQSRGRRLANELFGVAIRDNRSETPRLGLAVSLKVACTGVKRNRIRRAIRESFRLHQHELPGLDLVVSAREGASCASNGELRASLQALWSEVIKQCATLQKP